MEMKGNKLRNRIYPFLAAALALALTCGCGKKVPDEDHIDLSDPSAEGIVTAAQLLEALEEGADELALNASIDLGEDMLRLDRPGASLRIAGNGFTISGNADCIIRLAEGCSLVLEDVSLNAGSNAIGCLGDASISGSADIRAVAHAISAQGHVTVGEGSSLTVSSNVGSGVNAEGLLIEKNAFVRAEGALGGVAVTRDDIVLDAGSVLDASTDENYNALKCEGTLVMLDGSKLIVKNNGDYHGAEISEISVAGIVTIEATGGSKGVGLFLFALDESINVVGTCYPELRFEVGDGSLGFYGSPSEFPVPTPEATPAETEETPTG